MYNAKQTIPDLIYTDANKEDVGPVESYKLDMAYGSDENSFELSVPIGSAMIESGAYIYMENTEIGGVVDSFEINTEENVYVYRGRTWHGVLDKKIVCPNNGDDYFIIDASDCNKAIAQVLKQAGLTDYIDAEYYDDMQHVNRPDGNVYPFQPYFEISDPTGIMTPVYYQARYNTVYETLTAMLAEVGMKLKIQYPCQLENGLIIKSCKVYAVPLRDYTSDDEWNLHNKKYIASTVNRKINHLICLGQGDLKDRYVIHLYADENGGIVQWYKDNDYAEHGGGFAMTSYRKSGELRKVLYNVKTDEYYLFDDANQIYTFLASTKEELEQLGYRYIGPESISVDDIIPNAIYRDKDYIIDSGGVMTGIDDVVEVFDYPNADFTNNYLLMQYKPLDFDTNFSNYYSLEDTTFKELTMNKTYIIQTSKPVNWDVGGYTSSYQLIDGEYKPVSGKNTSKYDALTKQPADWSNNYSRYKYRTSDGTEYSYNSIPSVDVKQYVLQTNKPTDWAENYKAYFVNSVVYVKNKDKTWKANTYYDLVDGKYVLKKKKPSGWTKNYGTYFVKTNKKIPIPETVNDKAPSWKKSKYYTYKTVSSKAPDFAKFKKEYNGIFLETSVTTAPTWVANTYYSYVDVKPDFVPNQYYELSIDHYAELVRAGLKKLLEYQQQDSLEVNLPTEYEYDINDIVGITDDVTGLSITQPITKKIIVIDGNKQEISYQIGGK